jgi:hypothetical protein
MVSWCRASALLKPESEPASINIPPAVEGIVSKIFETNPGAMDFIRSAVALPRRARHPFVGLAGYAEIEWVVAGIVREMATNGSPYAVITGYPEEITDHQTGTKVKGRLGDLTDSKYGLFVFGKAEGETYAFPTAKLLGHLEKCARLEQEASRPYAAIIKLLLRGSSNGPRSPAGGPP